MAKFGKLLRICIEIYISETVQRSCKMLPMTRKEKLRILTCSAGSDRERLQAEAKSGTSMGMSKGNCKAFSEYNSKITVSYQISTKNGKTHWNRNYYNWCLDHGTGKEIQHTANSMSTNMWGNISETTIHASWSLMVVIHPWREFHWHFGRNLHWRLVEG